MLQRLPIGIQDFRKLREGNYKYIDKTMYIHRMCVQGGPYFLSRPRRFGKSLMLTTLQELYLGRKELFAGLWIEDKWDWSRKHPVIRISMKALPYHFMGLIPALVVAVDEYAETCQIALSASDPKSKFSELIRQVYARQGKVVVLIDEYDAPILDYLGIDTPKALEHRQILREFFLVLKEQDAMLELVMLTGVSKFSRVGIFSGLNNLSDLSMHPAYATMLGYTQTEVEANFAEELVDAARSLSMTKEQVLEKLRFWYNGYRFHPKAGTVYNPWSVQYFCAVQEFKNFWFETGTPTFLINLMRVNGVYNPTGEPHPEAFFSAFEPDQLQADTLLYQSGYLTIASRDEDGLYHLVFPNYEVRESLQQYLLAAFAGIPVYEGVPFVLKVRNAFHANDLERVFSLLETLFAGIPADIQPRKPQREAFYHAVLHLMFDYMGLRMKSEERVSQGRSDAVVETLTHLYVLEYKLDVPPAAGLAQIQAKGYAAKYRHRGKPVVLVAVSFSSETRNIAGWESLEIPAEG